jgi:carboxypeptidase T
LIAKNKILIYLLFLLLILCNIQILNGESILIKSENDIEKYEYYNYKNMTELLLELYYNNSDIMHLESLDKTYEKRDIWLVKISDNVSIDEDEPGVLLMAAHHGNEKPSFEVIIHFIKYIIENYRKNNTDNDNDGKINEDIIDGLDNDLDGLVDEDPSEDRVREVVNNTQIYLMPMVSPDGVEANSRKNCAPNYGLFDLKDEITSYGVNLNRNYGFKWNYQFLFPFRFHITNILDFSFNYRGPYPFSENESRAVKNMVEKSNISISLSYHSYLEAIFYPWTHTSLKAPHEDLFISIGKNMTKINKYRLLINGFRNKSYIIPRLGGNLGTSENWLYGVHGIIAFTVELCKTRAPTDPEIVYDYLHKHVGVNLYVCERSWTIEEEKEIAFAK